LAEHAIRNRGVVGSNPTSGSTKAEVKGGEIANRTETHGWASNGVLRFDSTFVRNRARVGSMLLSDMASATRQRVREFSAWFLRLWAMVASGFFAFGSLAALLDGGDWSCCPAGQPAALGLPPEAFAWLGVLSNLQTLIFLIFRRYLIAALVAASTLVPFLVLGRPSFLVLLVPLLTAAAGATSWWHPERASDQRTSPS
jgi:hypothetical protein